MTKTNTRDMAIRRTTACAGGGGRYVSRILIPADPWTHHRNTYLIATGSKQVGDLQACTCADIVQPPSPATTLPTARSAATVGRRGQGQTAWATSSGFIPTTRPVSPTRAWSNEAAAAATSGAPMSKFALWEAGPR